MTAPDQFASRKRFLPNGSRVCPGAVDTPILNEILDEAPDRSTLEQTIAAKHPIGRIATPNEVAAVIAFLASDDASFMTGLAVPVDGGRSVRF